MEEIITLAFWALWVILCYRIAEKNGRSTELACAMGLLFGLLAVIVYLVIGKKESEVVTKNTDSKSEIEDVKVD